MAQVFNAVRFLNVVASDPHPPNTEYRVAFGYEQWGDKKVAVNKVQMVYNTRVAGMLSPSYPVNTNDEKAVMKALELLHIGKGAESPKNRIVIIAVEEGTPHDQSKELIAQKYRSAYEEIETSVEPEVVFVTSVEIDKNLVGQMFQVYTNGYTKAQFISKLRKHGYEDLANELHAWRSSNNNNYGWDGFFSQTYKEIAQDLGLPTAFTKFSQ